MSPRNLLSAPYVLLLSFTASASAAGEQTNTNFSAIDAIIRDRAFRSLPLHRTNQPFRVHLPSNLSAVTATAVRLRGADLRRRGAGVGSFHLPPGILTAPHANRTLLVFHDFGNLSSSYFSVSGHVLVAPVLVFLAYDASNVTGGREVGLRPTRDLMTIAFPAPAVGTAVAAARCVLFMRNGTGSVGEGVMEGMRCAAMGTGHYSVVVPVGVMEFRQQRPEVVWVWVAAAVGCGVVAVAVVGLGMGVRRVGRKRGLEEMERKAEEGEVLGRVWVAGSELPAAKVVRTKPVIEGENVMAAFGSPAAK